MVPRPGGYAPTDPAGRGALGSVVPGRGLLIDSAGAVLYPPTLFCADGFIESYLPSSADKPPSSLQERIAAKLSGADAKIINAAVETDPAALPRPANEASWNIASRSKRNPKSTPERLAYAREYKRQRKAGNPNAVTAVPVPPLVD